jgi:hypothetical protein
MNSTVGNPEIGQWYERTDIANVFQVTGLDEADGTIETQSSDGDVGEIEARIWSGLPLERAQPLDDGLGPLEAMEAQDIASSQAETLLANPLALEQFAEVGSRSFAP